VWEENYNFQIFNRVALLGTGLMGGSLGMALRERGVAGEVVGYDRDSRVSQLAREKGAIDWFVDSPAAAVEGADLVVLAVPVRFSSEILKGCASYLAPGTIVTDVGSTKHNILEELAEHIPAEVILVGGHPMTGSDESGIGAADPTLWENAIYVLTPHKNVPTKQVEILQQMVYGIGAQPLILSPEDHDHLVALVSHLPHLIAVALVSLAAGDEKEDLVKLLAAGGFRDTTRVAMGNTEIWRDICITNRQAIDHFLGLYMEELENFRLIIKEGKESDLEQKLAEARDFRHAVPHKSRGILPELFDVVVLVKDAPGAIGKIATLLGEKELNIAEVEILHVREEEGGSIRFGFSSQDQRDSALEVLKNEGYRAHRRQ